MPATAFALARLALALALAVVAAADPAAAQWHRLAGPLPPPASGLVQHGDLWFMGTDHADQGDVFVSTDEGRSWSDAGRPNGGVATMLSHAGRLFVGSYLSGVFWSDDDGATWHGVDHPLASATVEALLPLDEQTMLAGADPFFPSPLYRSEDHGATWAALDGGPSLRCYDLALVDGVILAGGEGAGVWRSGDGGQVWTQSYAGLPGNATTYRFALVDGAVLAAAGTSTSPLAVYRSDDLGATWTQVSSDLPTGGGQRASLLRPWGGELYLGVTGTFGDRGLFSSTDGGVTWTHVTADLPGAPGVECAAIIDGELVVGTFDGAFRSGDGGATWSPTWEGASGVGGASALLWSHGRLHAGLDFTASNREAVVSTADLGASWQTAGGAGNDATAFDFTTADGTIYAALYGFPRGVGISVDGGQSYVVSNEGLPSGVVLYAVHVHEGVILAGASDALYRSTDDGASWDAVPGVAGVGDLISHDGFVYAGHYPGGVSRSDDGGATFTAINTGLGADAYINALAVFDGSVHAAVNSGPVARWNGESWEDTGLGGAIPYALLAVDGVLLAGTALSGIWLTTGEGGWSDFTEGYSGAIIESLAATPEHVVVGSRNRGVWVRPRGELPVITAVAEGAPAPVAGEVAVTPNPFNPLAVIGFDLPRSTRVTVDVHDAAGRRVRRLLDGSRPAGRHELRWNGRDDAGRAVAAGVYLVRVVRGGEVAVAKAVLVR